MRYLMRMLFPVLTVKRLNRHLSWLRLKAIYINTVPIGIRSRYVERLDAASSAEKMLGYASIKGIGNQAFLAA